MHVFFVKSLGRAPFGAKFRLKAQTAKRVLLAACLGLVLAAPGCTAFQSFQNNLAYNDSWNEWIISHRNRVYSARAWHRRKHHFCNEKYLVDFCRGFRAGYEDVASGSNGCTPAFPPREYWGWKYQSAEGQAKVAAWFSGYPHGARAAEEDGLNNWSQLQLSSTIQAEYTQAGLMPNGSGLYPIPGGQPSCCPPAVQPPIAGQAPPAMENAAPIGAPPVVPAVPLQ